MKMQFRTSRFWLQDHRMPKELWPGRKATAPSHLRLFWRPQKEWVFLFDIPFPKNKVGKK